MRNGVQLIVYADRFGGDGIARVAELLNGPLDGVFTGVHILPFFTPYDGADAGFDPADHTTVDPRLGTWDDVADLARTHDVMADLIVNHVSDQSHEFQDYLAKGDGSEYAGMFLTRERILPADAPEREIDAVYRPRPGRPFTTFRLGDGATREMWTTFTRHQIDIDVENSQAWDYLMRILDHFATAGLKQVRLDAVGYAIKRRGSSCFMIPETYDFIERLTDEIHRRSMETLVEIHGHYIGQIEIARTVDRVYDFALPPLILHTLHTGSAEALTRWLEFSPRNAITVLDTHDGIGIVDVASGHQSPGLLADEAVDGLVETIHTATNGESRLATGTAASNLDLYQVNSTYLAALGYDENMYLLARMIQFFCPGIPQVYYAGLLAVPNDMELLAQTRVGRNINRPFLSDDQLESALERPVVKRLCRLARLRNTHPAFDGEFSLALPSNDVIELMWLNGEHQANASIAVGRREFSLTLSGSPSPITGWDDLPGSQ